METNRILGACLFTAGTASLAFFFNYLDAPLEHLSRAFTSQLSDRDVWGFRFGIAAAVSGGLIVAIGPRK